MRPLAEKFIAFGWDVEEVDGHDHGKLLDVLAHRQHDKPLFVVAKTTKGKGVSFMEGRVEWHHKVPSDEQVAKALRELA